MRRIRDWFAGLPLRQKILLSILSCLLIPTFVSSTISSYLTRDVMAEQVRVNGGQALNVSNLYVSNLMDSMIHMANNVQFNIEMRSLLREFGKPEPNMADIIIKGKTVTNTIETMVFSQEGLYMTILLPNGIYFSNYGANEFVPQRFMNEPWFKDLRDLSFYDALWTASDGSYISSSETGETPGYITLAKTLKNDNNRPYAYIILSIEELQFRNFFQKYSATQELMIVDEHGIIISHPDPGQIGRVSAHQDFLRQKNSSQLAVVDGEDFLLQKTNLSANQWQILSLLPYNKAVQEIQFFRHTDLVVLLISLLIFILILTYLIRQFTAPLNKLSWVALRVEMEELDLRSNVRGKDEVGKLGRVFDRMLDRIQMMIENIKEEQSRKRMAELKMLQAQIHPHFLFNTLNSIRLRIMMKGDEESAALITSLSSLLRMTINSSETITLHEEVSTVRDYVQIMQARQKETMEVDIRLASNTMFEEIPKFTLQPLIENAIIHGLKHTGGVIRISSWRTEGWIYILIDDNGAGMSQERLDSIRLLLGTSPPPQHPGLSGIGIMNVCERLRLIHGDSFQMEIDSSPGNGTKVLLHIPIQEKGGKENVQDHAG
jgi:two-component system sensor histidine kinase YesM